MLGYFDYDTLTSHYCDPSIPNDTQTTKYVPEKLDVFFSKIRNVKTPQKAFDTDAGFDWFVPEDFEKTPVFPGNSILIHSGIRVIVPEGWALIFFNKSGIASKKHLVLGACVIDQFFENEVLINLNNISHETAWIEPGMKIVQSLLIPVPKAEFLEVNQEQYDEIMAEMKRENKNTRGMGGFGSTDGK